MFPEKNWDLIIPQVNIIINLVRPSRINPLISAYNQVHGAFDCNSTPMAPIGTKVILFDQNRAKWDGKGITSYYIGPVMKHYQNFVYYNPVTNKTRTHDTIQWFPHNDSFPFVPGTATTTNLLLLELIDTLNRTQNDAPSTSDVPALIRQICSLLHKQNVLPSNNSVPNSTERLKQPLPTSKGGQWSETAKQLRAILIKPPILAISQHYLLAANQQTGCELVQYPPVGIQQNFGIPFPRVVLRQQNKKQLK